ncbi:hypothetical protein, unlikely [Trypanosoma brucei gambiense DAL972]|uniref:Uncharacterized protein n=1 Tax=Trypanosoma brucei gambiense (strain MHOM/CI/86/DAL972) TaxID=679716 RepID=C9ZIY7_TRYB9|nr:hypothetical protein, unlikely [Trypanosoma brucei gambiense DAL972]CBH09315.1 hypothetical protein, unlikely [Trypanosoma brucei gambiense DAL972]|eukprot:XP_011771623.1 hypothetical protein, unlikely [Trypanosoma brucei gambiense DAL972]
MLTNTPSTSQRPKHEQFLSSLLWRKGKHHNIVITVNPPGHYTYQLMLNHVTPERGTSAFLLLSFSSIPHGLIACQCGHNALGNSQCANKVVQQRPMAQMFTTITYPLRN